MFNYFFYSHKKLSVLLIKNGHPTQKTGLFAQTFVRLSKGTQTNPKRTQSTNDVDVRVVQRLSQSGRFGVKKPQTQKTQARSRANTEQLLELELLITKIV